MWREVRRGLYYNPDRISEGRITESLLDLVKARIRPMPLEVLDARGYLITFFESEDAYVIRMLAADFETDIDHRLDEMRFHRSRVNFINHVEPVGVKRVIRLRSDSSPTVYTPFNESPSDIKQSGDVCTITLPEKTSFLILRFAK